MDSQIYSIHLFLLISGLASVLGDTFNVDLENTGVCTSVTPVPVGPNDVYNIYAEPQQDGKGVRDKCTVRFFSTNGETFKLYVQDLFFRECQINIRFYDGDIYLNTPRYSFGCNSATGNLFKSFTSNVAISLEKPDATSTGYKFKFILALDSGPDIAGGGGNAGDGTGISTGVLVVLVIAAILVIAVIVGIVLYCLVVYRRKKEEKEMAFTRSRSTVFGTATTIRDGESVHSSKHSLHSTHSTHSTHHTKDSSQFSYPAFRTKASISEKAPKCNSIDTRSYDSDAIDQTDNQRKPIIAKNVKNEFNAMKKGLEREEHYKRREKEDLEMQERRWKEVKQTDRRAREETNRGLGRSNSRGRNSRTVLNEENVKRSARADRQHGRSHDDYDDRFQRSSRAGSSRSTRTKDRSRGHSPARSGGAWSEPDYISRHRDSSPDRGRERSNSASRKRSHSSGTQSRRKRDYYVERDAYSDYDDSRYRSSSRDRSNSHRSHRSGTQRTRSHSSSRHNR